MSCTARIDNALAVQEEDRSPCAPERGSHTRSIQIPCKMQVPDSTRGTVYQTFMPNEVARIDLFLSATAKTQQLEGVRQVHQTSIP